MTLKSMERTFSGQELIQVLLTEQSYYASCKCIANHFTIGIHYKITYMRNALKMKKAIVCGE